MGMSLARTNLLLRVTLYTVKTMMLRMGIA